MERESRLDANDLDRIDAEGLARLRSFAGITDAVLGELAARRGIAETLQAEIVGGFYEVVATHPETAPFLADSARMAEFKEALRRHYGGLFEGRCDLDYASDRLQEAKAAERAGLSLKWFIAACARGVELAGAALRKALPPEDAAATTKGLQKLVFFDLALAAEAYTAAQAASIGRHRAATEELSTPVIEVFDGVLLLPLIGTIDSARAQGIMEVVLQRVVDLEARVMIIDIAGVAVVDTQVADHLLRCYAAVRLLGAATILTGISPAIARTVTDLGVDMSSLHTRSQLARGISLALSLTGRTLSEAVEA